VRASSPVSARAERQLADLGERLRLARKQRRLSNAAVAVRVGISRTTLYKVEAGDPGATLGSYVRVLVVLGLEGDLNQLAADDRLGRKLQDLALEPKRRDARRASGLRPVQIWVPDTRRTGFAEECRRQSLVVAAADAADADLNAFMDAALAPNWTTRRTRCEARRAGGGRHVR